MACDKPKSLLRLTALVLTLCLGGTLVFANAENSKPKTKPSPGVVDEPRPIDDWNVPQGFFEKEKPKADAGKSRPESDEPQELSEEELQALEDGEILDFDEPEEVETPVPTPPPEEKARLNKPKKTRLKRAEHKQRVLIARQRRQFQVDQRRDPRGEAEVRVCSVNLNNYGSAKDFSKVMRGRNPAGVQRRARTAVRAITDIGCDVAAVQAIIGKKRPVARTALEKLATLLKEQTARNWTAYLSESNLNGGRHGFLVQDTVEVRRFNSHKERQLPKFSLSTLRTFPRGPFEIEFRVPGKGPALSKNVTVMTMYLRSKVSSKKTEPELKRMHMAEALRRMMEYKQRNLSLSEPEIFLLAGDRAGPMRTPASMILSGAWRLRDFRSKGPCAVNAEGEASCEEGAAHLRVLFGVIGESLVPTPTLIKRVEDEQVRYLTSQSEKRELRRLRRKNRDRWSEIYLFQPDLMYAREDPLYAMRYKSGAVPIGNGMRESPLVWVELNW